MVEPPLCATIMDSHKLRKIITVTHCKQNYGQDMKNRQINAFAVWLVDQQSIRCDVWYALTHMTPI